MHPRALSLRRLDSRMRHLHLRLELLGLVRGLRPVLDRALKRRGVLRLLQIIFRANVVSELPHRWEYLG